MNLDFLSEDKHIQEICRKYWEMKNGKFVYTISSLQNEYQLKQKELLSLVQENCFAYLDDVICVRCQDCVPFNTRKSLTDAEKLHQSRLLCDYCSYEIAKEKQERQYVLEKKRYDYLQDTLLDSLNHFPDKDFTLLNQIYLLALIRFAISEDLSYIQSISKLKYGLFTPSEELTRSLLIELYRKNLLAINPDNDIRTFNWEDGSCSSFRFDLMKVDWNLIIPKNHSIHEFIQLLTDNLNGKRTYDAEITFKLCEQILLHECLSYLSYSIDEYRLNFSAGEKTIFVLKKALKDFSVSQIYYFIDKACKDAVANYARGTFSSKKHAANTIVNSIERLTERAILEKWNIKEWGRIKSLPQSYLSIVLFENILGLKDGGFHHSLSELNTICQDNDCTC